MKKNLKWLLLLQICGMAMAPILFSVIEAKNWAGVLAGTGFLFIGVLSFFYFKALNPEVFLVRALRLGWLLFIVFLSVPQIFIRTWYWQQNSVKDLELFYGFNFQHLHELSTVTYMTLFILGLLLWKKVLREHKL